MCDYSLHHVGSRPAKVSDKLVTTEFAKAGTRGFAAVGELGAKLVIDEVPPRVAVCLLPGTELAFDDDVAYDRGFSFLGKARLRHRLARFRQIDTSDPHVHHDALEFPDGQVLKVTRLVPGQTARVLQLPANASHHDHDDELAERARAARRSTSRLALNRVALRPGMASFLMPSQNSAMLWQSCRRTLVGLSNALERSFRRLKPRESDAGGRIAVPAAAEAEHGAGNLAESGIAAAPSRTSAVPEPKSRAAA